MRIIGIVALVAVVGFVAPTLAATSKSRKTEKAKMTTTTSQSRPTTAPSDPKMVFDTKPGPAFMMVDGKLNKIDGNFYVVEDFTGKEMRLYVSKDTKKMRGEKKPGDLIRAEVTKGWYANSIQ